MARAKSTWREQRVTVPAGARVPVTWKDTNPNTLFLANNSNTRVFISQASNVSDTIYDMIVPPYGTRVYSRPDPIGTLFLYALAEARVYIASMETDFTPLLIPQTQEISAAGTAGLLGTVDINHFLSPLPAGSNEIGFVQISGFQVPLPAGENKIGKVDIVGEQATVPQAAGLPQVFKVVAGSDGQNAYPIRVTSSGRLVIQATDLLVRTTTPLAANGQYESGTRSVAGYGRLVGAVLTDQDGTLCVEQSIDGGSNFDVVDQLSITAGTTARFDYSVIGDIARVRYVNGPAAQATFRLAVFGKVI